MFLKAAINGGRTTTDHPATPVTPEAIARAAVAARSAGADVVHLHPRTVDGAQSSAAREVDAAIAGVRWLDPELAVGVTTGLWTCSGHAERMANIRGWSVLPDFASVAYSEEGAEEAAHLILERGMQLESAVWSMENVPALLASSVLHYNVRVLIEPLDEDPRVAVASAREMARAIRAAGVGAPLLYHGDGPTVWPVLRAAAEDGVQARIGLEDGTELPDGRLAADNVELIQAATQTYLEIAGTSEPAASAQ